MSSVYHFFNTELESHKNLWIILDWNHWIFSCQAYNFLESISISSDFSRDRKQTDISPFLVGFFLPFEYVICHHSVICAAMAVCTMAGHSPDPLPSRQIRDGCGGSAGSEGVTRFVSTRKKHIFPGKMDG